MKEELGYIKLKAKNSTSGNPQRLYCIIYNENGNCSLEIKDEGYEAETPESKYLGTIEISKAEYHHVKSKGLRR